MAPLSAERIQRAYHDADRHPGVFAVDMIPLIDIMLEHPMVRTEITMTPGGLEYRPIPIDFQQLSIWRRAYESPRQNELPVYVVAPFSVKPEITPGNSKDWFSWQVSYPVQNGDARIFWKTGKDRFNEVEIWYSLFTKTLPATVKHPETTGYVDNNGRLGYALTSSAATFGAVFVGCELLSKQGDTQIPHQVLLFG